MADWRTALNEYIAREAKPVEKYGHQPRLYALTRRVGAGQSYDDDIVYAAAWLHDIGVFVGHRPEEPEALAQWDNVAYAMERAPVILKSIGFPQGKIDAVIEAIRTHQPKALPDTIEGAILREADILEQLGAIGVLRQVCKVGRDTRYATFTDVIASLRWNLTTLPEKLRFRTARDIAEARIRALQDFLSAVDAEAGSELF